MLSGKIGFIYPTFEEYPNRVEEDRRVVFTPSEKNGFRYTVDDLIGFFSENPVSSIVLINPDNPSGNFLPKKEILRFVKWTKRKGVRILIDESFVDFSSQPYTMLDSEFLSKNIHVNVLKSISKSYGVPGLRLGILACGNESQAAVVQSKLSIWNINSFGEFFLQIVEKYSEEYKVACSKVAKERERFVRELNKFKIIKAYPSAGNFVLCEVLSPYTAKRLTTELWLQSKCLIKDCSWKKGFKKGEFVRLAVKSENDNNLLLSALSRLS